MAALTSKKIIEKTLPLFGILSDDRGEKTNYFFVKPTRKEVFIKKTRKKTTRQEPCKCLKELKLAVTLSKVINHFFSRLLVSATRYLVERLLMHKKRHVKK